MEVDWEIEKPFLNDIAGNLDDATPRFIYADWLEEQGDPRCEVIRISERFRERYPRPNVATMLSDNQLLVLKDCWCDYESSVRFGRLITSYQIDPQWLRLAGVIRLGAKWEYGFVDLGSDNLGRQIRLAERSWLVGWTYRPENQAFKVFCREHGLLLGYYSPGADRRRVENSPPGHRLMTERDLQILRFTQYTVSGYIRSEWTCWKHEFWCLARSFPEVIAACDQGLSYF